MTTKKIERGKTQSTGFKLPAGLKPVAAPKNATRRAWHREEETPGSGGTHSVKPRTISRSA